MHWSVLIYQLSTDPTQHDHWRMDHQHDYASLQQWRLSRCSRHIEPMPPGPRSWPAQKLLRQKWVPYRGVESKSSFRGRLPTVCFIWSKITLCCSLFDFCSISFACTQLYTIVQFLLEEFRFSLKSFLSTQTSRPGVGLWFFWPGAGSPTKIRTPHPWCLIRFTHYTHDTMSSVLSSTETQLVEITPHRVWQYPLSNDSNC